MWLVPSDSRRKVKDAMMYSVVKVRLLLKSEKPVTGYFSLHPVFHTFLGFDNLKFKKFFQFLQNRFFSLVDRNLRKSHICRKLAFRTLVFTKV